MKRDTKIIVALILAICLGAALFYTYESNGTNYEIGSSHFNDQIRSSNPILFEGLPHRGWEGELFKQELRKDHFESKGHAFYSARIDVSDSDRDFLESIFLQNRVEPSSWDIAKACGGFHPDLLIIWEDSEDRRSEAYFCFTCAEVRFYSGIYRLKADIPESVLSDLRKLGAIYNKQRPASKNGESDSAE